MLSHQTHESRPPPPRRPWKRLLQVALTMMLIIKADGPAPTEDGCSHPGPLLYIGAET